MYEFNNTDYLIQKYLQITKDCARISNRRALANQILPSNNHKSVKSAITTLNSKGAFTQKKLRHIIAILMRYVKLRHYLYNDNGCYIL